MSVYLVTDTQLTDLADNIRANTGISTQLSFPAGFKNAINGIIKMSDLELETTSNELFCTVGNGRTIQGNSSDYSYTVRMLLNEIDGILLPSSGSGYDRFIILNPSGIRCDFVVPDWMEVAASSTITVTSSLVSVPIVIRNHSSSTVTIPNGNIFLPFTYYKSVY